MCPTSQGTQFGGGLNRLVFQGPLPAPPRTPGGSCQGETEGPGVENCWNSFLCIPGLSAPCLAAEFPTLRAEGTQDSLPAQNTRDFPLFSESAAKKGWETQKSRNLCICQVNISKLSFDFPIPTQPRNEQILRREQAELRSGL